LQRADLVLREFEAATPILVQAAVRPSSYYRAYEAVAPGRQDLVDGMAGSGNAPLLPVLRLGADVCFSF